MNLLLLCLFHLLSTFFFFFNWQGKNAEGIIHLERVASLKEPEDPKSKVHYFDGLVLLARYELEQLTGFV